MKLAKLLLAIALPCFPLSAFSLDAACAPMLATGEAKIKQAAWHSVMLSGKDFRMENMKVGGGFFRQMNGVWSKSPVNLDEAEKAMLAQVKSGEVKITQCSRGPVETIDGVAVYPFKSTVEMKGAPAQVSTLYIGKADSLPYKQVGATFTVTYKYKNISAPSLK